jgi:hypothetical protein
MGKTVSLALAMAYMTKQQFVQDAIAHYTF